MPAILAIETSTTHGSIAVLRDGVTLFEHHLVAKRSHNSAIFHPLEQALAACDRDISRIVIGTGPGSYTGIRIGIAAATGIALACHAELVAVPSLCAANIDRDSFTIIGNARRGSWFRSDIEHRKLIGEPALMSEEELLKDLPGDALTFDETCPFQTVDTIKPSAVWLAKLATGVTPTDVIEPIYLRAPFITKPKKIGK